MKTISVKTMYICIMYGQSLLKEKFYGGSLSTKIMSVIKDYDYECPNSRFDNLLKTHPIAATVECFKIESSSIHYMYKDTIKWQNVQVETLWFYISNIDRSKSCHDM